MDRGHSSFKHGHDSTKTGGKCAVLRKGLYFQRDQSGSCAAIIHPRAIREQFDIPDVKFALKGYYKIGGTKSGVPKLPLHHHTSRNEKPWKRLVLKKPRCPQSCSLLFLTAFGTRPLLDRNVRLRLRRFYEWSQSIKVKWLSSPLTDRADF